MSGREATAAEPSARLAGWAAVAAGAALLLARPWIRGAGGTPALAIGFVVLTVLAVRAPLGDPAESPALSPAVVLILGCAAVAMAAFVAGPAPRPPVMTAVLALNVGAAVAEEAFFRRALYGRLVPMGAGVAVLGSAVAFALLHVPLYGWALAPIDLGAGLVLSWQRWASGSWTAPAATHALANVLAVLR